MDKFILVSLLLVVFSVDCFGLKCHFCKNSTNFTTTSHCPHGAETVVKECTIQADPTCSTYISQKTRERVSLGCRRYRPLCRPVRHKPGSNSTVVTEDIYACYCNTDSCNVYTEKDEDLRTCKVCKPYGEEGPNYCSNGELGDKIMCALSMKYCFTTFTSPPGGGHNDRQYDRECAEKIPAEDDKFSKFKVVNEPQPASCRFQFENGVIKQECFCSSNSCNLDFEDISDFKICNVCGGGNNLCGAGEEGEAKVCPLNMKYCFTTFTSPPGGGQDERRYYRACAEKIPAEDDKFSNFKVVNEPKPASCRFQFENGVIRQECFCSSNACNVNFGDISDFKICNVCGGGDNLCAAGEEGEAKLCPTGMTYCKNIWEEHPGEQRKYYKGCASEPSEKNKFQEVSTPPSSFCRLELLDDGGLRQECFCPNSVCNRRRNEFSDLPNFRCSVCTQGGGTDNLCAPGEKGEIKLCPKPENNIVTREMTYCKYKWTQYFDEEEKERQYYKGCATQRPPTSSDKYTEVNNPTPAFCRQLRDDQDLITQECYCTSNDCNSRHFDDLPTPDPSPDPSPTPDSTLYCFVCIRGRGEDNLCAPGEKGEVKQCGTGMTYYKSTFTDHPGLGKVHYKGCAEEPTDKNKFTDSAPCHSEQGKGVAGQECYCKSNLCNVHFDHLLNSNINNGNNVVPSPEGDVGEGIQEYENGCYSPNKGVNTFVCVIIAPAIYYFI